MSDPRGQARWHGAFEAVPSRVGPTWLVPLTGSVAHGSGLNARQLFAHAHERGAVTLLGDPRVQLDLWHSSWMAAG